MKYAHLADLHLGSWREEKMKELSIKVFLTTIDDCISKEVDFILIAGDLFNTSLPSLDTLKIVTKKLKELQDQNIPVYAIAGSHDFSPSGKTMLDVLENAGLLTNVCQGFVNENTKKLNLKFTIDQKTKIKITGMLGKKGLLDKVYYQDLELNNLEDEPGYKIFMFHTTLSELKPKHLEMMEAQPLSFLPKKFNYYAGGHVHHPTKTEVETHGTLTYPGALFPNNFAELEKYEKGGYYLITINEKVNNDENVHKYSQNIEFIPIEIIKTHSLKHNCNHQSPENIFLEITSFFDNLDITNSLVLIRLTGSLEKGKISDINFKDIFNQLYNRGAYYVMRNTSQLHSQDYEEVKIDASSPENFEEEIIKEHLQQIKLFDIETELHLTKSLLTDINTTKKEGETVTDFQKRVEDEINQLMNIQSDSTEPKSTGY